MRRHLVPYDKYPMWVVDGPAYVERCHASVAHGWHHHQCSRKGVVDWRGLQFCRQHARRTAEYDEGQKP